MSFILDALKKSERERERQQQPMLVEIPYGRRSRRPPWWLLIVVGLLVVNCVLLLIMWWRSDNKPVVTPSVVGSAVSSSVAASSTPAVVFTTPRAIEVRPLQDEANNDPATDTGAPLDETATALESDNTPTAPPLVRPATGLERAMAQQQDMATRQKANSQGTSPITSPDNTPTLAGLGGSGALNLPELRLDVHVYSRVDVERFVFINGHKYVEGQNLSEGPHLDQITKEGVMLSYRSQRFLVPRQ